ncbi:MAG: DUF58 domain-containing protein [Spirochaetaceae bacterium]|jgi:uncharacterized protein (DUF58 family)|nr:DUF58 domain-containing protein [Spirochaetaceae bacterium]
MFIVLFGLFRYNGGMDRRALLEKIAVFPIVARGLAEDLRSGAYRSVFRGNGIEFDEVRDYRTGDDIRAIDRNVSARFGRPYVKLYREEREFSLCVALDQSLSMRERGASERSRYEQALLAMCLLGFSAEKAGQQFGAVFFDSEVRQVWPCRQGTGHLLAMADAALESGEPVAHQRGTALDAAMRQVMALCKRRSLVVIISDFLSDEWETGLPRLCRSHDCICVRIALPAENAFPKIGLAVIEDMESNKTVHAAASSAFQAAWKSFFERRAAKWADACMRAGAAALTLSVDDEVDGVLPRFFNQRRRT